MGRNAVTACAAVLVLCVLSGCGTRLNLSGNSMDGVQGAWPYGGVRTSANMAKGFIIHNDSTPEHPDLALGAIECTIGAVWLFIDLPLSFVGDTVTLPYVLYLKAQRDRLARSLEPAAE